MDEELLGAGGASAGGRLSGVGAKHEEGSEQNDDETKNDPEEGGASLPWIGFRVSAWGCHGGFDADDKGAGIACLTKDCGEYNSRSGRLFDVRKLLTC